jgi:3-isopropylmalate/(R)-2-methylmalate dehydratase small subunit
MQPFTTVSGIAAPLLQENLNTDLIIPKQFLTTLLRSGLGRHLFHPMRYREDGSEEPGFILNQEPYRRASILLGGPNFGCGSSREHAPWALLDFGIRVVVAPSFADIFCTNAFKNGLLPAVVSLAALAALAAHPGELAVDLEAMEIRAGSARHPFQTEPWGRTMLLGGLDEIQQTLASLPAIEAFEARRAATAPWL